MTNLPKPHNGSFRKCMGKYQGVDGKLRSKVFYLGSNAIVAQKRLERLALEYVALRNEGHEVWSPSKLTQLEAEGICGTLEGAAKTRKEIVAAMSADVPDVDLAPFMDVGGNVPTEALPQAVDYVCRALASHPSALNRLKAQVWRDLTQGDTWVTYERMARFCGWNQQQTNAFLNFNVNGNATISPIAFDASEDRGKATNALEAAGIIDLSPVDKGEAS